MHHDRPVGRRVRDGPEGARDVHRVAREAAAVDVRGVRLGGRVAGLIGDRVDPGDVLVRR
jgi:hypothetical protein